MYLIAMGGILGFWGACVWCEVSAHFCVQGILHVHGHPTVPALFIKFFIFFVTDLKCRFCHKSRFHICVHLFMNSIFCSISQFDYNCPIPYNLNYYNQVNLKNLKSLLMHN